jgi:hypothetical protein
MIWGEILGGNGKSICVLYICSKVGERTRMTKKQKALLYVNRMITIVIQ